MPHKQTSWNCSYTFPTGWHNGSGTLYYLCADGKCHLQFSVWSDSGAESSSGLVSRNMNDSTTSEKERDSLWKTGYRKKPGGFLQILGQHRSLGLFKHLCLLMSPQLFFSPCFAFFLGKMCYSLGIYDWPHTIVFPGKEVVTSLPFAVGAWGS